MDVHRVLRHKFHSADQWSGESIASSLTPDFLANVKACYQNLEPQVKTKLLLAILNMPKRMIDAASSQLFDILALAEKDTAEWSRVLSKMLKNYPKEGKINNDVDIEIYQEVVKNISKLLLEPASANLRPHERLYMNTGSSGKIILTQHFKLSTKKHKSAAARVEILMKGKELQEQRKREKENKEDSVYQQRRSQSAVPTPAPRKPVSNYKASFKHKEESEIKNT